MTKHNDITKNPSTFIVKQESQWCSLCGIRSNFSVEITYPDNAETKIKQNLDLARQIQGNKHTTNINNSLNDLEFDSIINKNLIRICKRCLNYSLKMIYEEERYVMSHS